MDKRDIASQAERYKREMMKLYGRSTSEPPETVQESTPSIIDAAVGEEKPPEAPEETDMNMETGTGASADDSGSSKQEGEADINELDRRYPEPDLSDLQGLEEDYEEDAPQPVYSEESFGNSVGYIKVNVRTGDDSAPIKNAVVTVTGTLDGNRMFMASGVTDESGTIEAFEVPVPDISYSQTPDSKVRPYSLYDISVTAGGFFNTRSVDVPVFPGIISVQNFGMVPVPLYMSSSDETVTYYNQEPRL